MEIILAVVISFVLTALMGKALIPALVKLKVGQSIKEIGPKWHMTKQGTPTMGGLMFIFAVILCLVGNLGSMKDYTVFYVLALSLCFGLVGFLDDDEGIGVNIHNELFQLRQLALAHHGQNHFHILLGIGPGPMEVGRAALQLPVNGLHNGLMLLGDDQGHPGIVKAIDHGINDLAADKDHNTAVKGLADVLEHQARQQHHGGIKNNGYSANGHIAVLLF